MSSNLSVREIQTDDIPPLINYWLSAGEEFLRGMGADPAKIPPKDEWEKMLLEQISQSYEEKKAYCIIWLAGGEAVGHSNVNKIIYGQEAYMHLHLWKSASRKTGWGTSFLKMTLPLFFENLKLKTLYCEPYALNTAPNKVLEKLGFDFIKTYITTPGYLNFEQPVNRWQLSRDKFRMLNFPS